jgi:hypothetical protein
MHNSIHKSLIDEAAIKLLKDIDIAYNENDWNELQKALSDSDINSSLSNFNFDGLKSSFSFINKTLLKYLSIVLGIVLLLYLIVSFSANKSDVPQNEETGSSIIVESEVTVVKIVESLIEEEVEEVVEDTIVTVEKVEVVDTLKYISIRSQLKLNKIIADYKKLKKETAKKVKKKKKKSVKKAPKKKKAPIDKVEETEAVKVRKPKKEKVEDADSGLPKSGILIMKMKRKE